MREGDPAVEDEDADILLLTSAEMDDGDGLAGCTLFSPFLPCWGSLVNFANMLTALRHAPPQRVLFGAAADGSAGRQTRGSANQNSPTPGSTGANGTYGSNGAAFTIANYEPRAVVASTVKPIVTPANNPQYYRDKAKQILLARKGAKGYSKPRGPMMLPGSK
jgi:hypothetical protein